MAEENGGQVAQPGVTACGAQSFTRSKSKLFRSGSSCLFRWHTY